MRIQYVSDLHLEFHDNAALMARLPLGVEGDVLVIAGDTMPLRDFEAYRQHRLKLGRAYLEGLYDLDVYGAIREYKGPVSIFYVDKEQVVNLSYAERAEEAYENATLMVLPGEALLILKKGIIDK